MTFLDTTNKIMYGKRFLIKYWRLERLIGGGDTGSDCVGTSNRQGAKSVTISRSCLNHLLDEAKLHPGLTGHIKKHPLHIRKVVTGIG
jgi:hypothetical protein